MKSSLDHYRSMSKAGQRVAEKIRRREDQARLHEALQLAIDERFGEDFITYSPRGGGLFFDINLDMDAEAAGEYERIITDAAVALIRASKEAKKRRDQCLKSR